METEKEEVRLPKGMHTSEYFSTLSGPTIHAGKRKPPNSRCVSSSRLAVTASFSSKLVSSALFLALLHSIITYEDSDDVIRRQHVAFQVQQRYL